MADVRYWIRASSQVVCNLWASWMVDWIHTDKVHLHNNMEIDKNQLQ